MRTRPSPFSDDPVSTRHDEAAHGAAESASAHRSVLLREAVDLLDIQPDETIVDATLGGAGHARALCGKLDERGTFIGFDLDADAIERAKIALAPFFAKATKGPRVILIQGNFRDLQKELKARDVRRIAKILFDLGWSSYQLDSGRGFSIAADEPLRMTYAKGNNAVTAAVIVNDWSEATLAGIIYGFGEERYARRIAKAIVERRSEKPFTTARELAAFIATSVPPAYRHGRIHPATRTFQALRIAVNDEFGALSQALRDSFELLERDGRIAVITFHSLEDRLVKRFFAELEKAGEGRRLTKKPIAPTAEEIRTNRRSRSAKLRVFLKHDKTIAQNKQIQTPPAAGEV